MPQDKPKNLSELCQKTYKDQAIWFLNGFWEDGLDKEANTVWDYTQHFIELDRLQQPPKGPDGNELDMFWSAKFLEDKDEAIPAVKRKEILRAIDHDNNGKMAAVEYFIWKYNKTVEQVMNSPQGENRELIEAAQKKMEEVQAALADVAEKIEANKEALGRNKDATLANNKATAENNAATDANNQATAENNAAKDANEKATAANKAKLAEVAAAKAANEAAMEEVRVANAALLEAEAELKAARAEQEAQEAAYNAKIKELEEKSQQGGTVSRGKAANELAQLKSEDPLPLRRAKITTEAAIRKVEAQTKEAHEKIALGEQKQAELNAAEADLESTKAELERTAADLEAARQRLEATRQELERTAAELERTRQELEETAAELARTMAELESAQVGLENKMSEAAKELEEAKNSSGVAYGAIYWMERELFEADKSLARARQKYDHTKPFSFVYK